MTESTDEELMQRFTQGDSGALAVLYSRYKMPVLNFCLRFLSNRSDAEDVTGNVFLALFSGRYVSVEGVKFSTWLFTVARNRCLDVIRAKKPAVPAENLPLASPSAAGATAMSQEEKMQHIKQAIKQLPIDQQQAIILRSYHGKDYQEIAHILNCSVANVKILLFRARERLKGELASFIKEEQS